MKMGCPRNLSFLFVLIWRAFITAETESGKMMMASSGSSGAPSSSSWTEDSVGLRILLESSSKTTTTEGTSVNQPEAGSVPPANPIASSGEEAGPSNRALPVVPYPYQRDEVIGGDSVAAIEQRLLSKNPFPHKKEREFARIKAEDQFEVKVEIIKVMAGLDPNGDWMGRGARALDNSRTATGDEPLERLYGFLEDLQRGGVQSHTYRTLKERVFYRMDPDEHSSA